MTPYGAVATRRDQLAEALRTEIKRLMAHHGNMQQIELVRRSGQNKQRIQRFLSGQMPYPPLTFLDKLFRVFGHTLLDGLRGSIQPVTQLPILRPDVQQLADTCAPLEPAGVAVVQHLAVTLRDGVQRSSSKTPNAFSRRTHRRNTSGTRNTRKG